MQAAFGEAMHRVTREPMPIYLTINNGRSAHPALQQCVGMFVKTLPVTRPLLSGQPTTAQFVEAVHQQLMTTYSQDFYPYTRMVERYGLKAEVMFIFQGDIESNDMDEAQIPLELNATKFPVVFSVYTGDDGYVLDEEGYVISGEKYAVGAETKRKVIVEKIPANAYRYDGRPEFVAVSGTPGAVAGVLTLMTVQYNEQTKNIKIGHFFDWQNSAYEIIDVNFVGVDINSTHGTIKLQAKRAAGGLHGYE
jgi:hypothetical protein